jgi:hypothetical protein
MEKWFILYNKESAEKNWKGLPMAATLSKETLDEYIENIGGMNDKLEIMEEERFPMDLLWYHRWNLD